MTPAEFRKAVAYGLAIQGDVSPVERTQAACEFQLIANFRDAIKVHDAIVMGKVPEAEQPKRFTVNFRGDITASVTVDAASEEEAKQEALELIGFDTNLWDNPYWHVESIENES